MGRPSKASQDAIARGCQRAVYLAGDVNRLTNARCDELGVAAAFCARALARFGDRPAAGSRSAAAFDELEHAGKAIGAELRRRAT